jgi:hypothetical protein
MDKLCVFVSCCSFAAFGIRIWWLDQKDIMNKPTKALNDISLSAMEPYYPAQFSVAGAARETELVENFNASQVVQTNSISAPRRFVPLSAPARGSVTM